MRPFLRALLPALDLLASPFVWLAALLLRTVRRLGVSRMPYSKIALLRAGVFPIRDHFYEPLFDEKRLRRSLDEDRKLPGIEWNLAGQLELLSSIRTSAELNDVPLTSDDDLTFHWSNGAFDSGDAEFWHHLIRLKKPARIIEIGSGYSTLMARRAIRANQAESPGYACQHVCIEPYQMPWLERTGVTVLRQRVEELDVAFFQQLERGDVLFIDSSHVIRPQGDVLFEYLELLPTLKPGVIVHVHDIRTPRDYLRRWLIEEVRLWNEQYLLEAFLTNNREWKILAALNHLQHHHGELLREKCPHLTPAWEPMSFYMEKVG
jgi:hypothetical protein